MGKPGVNEVEINSKKYTEKDFFCKDFGELALHCTVIYDNWNLTISIINISGCFLFRGMLIIIMQMEVLLQLCLRVHISY